MNRYEIWSEGFRATGESGTAHFHGFSYGKDFQDACDRFFESQPEGKKYYNREQMDYWGCNLYSDESEARESFG